MLYTFKKYQNLYNIPIDFKYKNKNLLVLSHNYLVFKYSTFFRKMFFRTLLLYLNMLSCNLCYTCDKNFFYLTAFMCSTYSHYHPSFYFKYIFITQYK